MNDQEEIDDNSEEETGVVEILSNEVGFEVGRECNSCYLKDSCQLFKAGMKCAVDRDYKAPANAQDIVLSLTALMKAQLIRVNRMLHIEAVEGGYSYVDTSNEMDRYFEYAKKLKDLMDNSETIEIKAKGPGVLSKFFGINTE